MISNHHLSGLASGLYTCSVTLQPVTDQQTRVLSVSMTNLLVRAGLKDAAFSGEQASARLPLEPGLYSDQSELLLSKLHPTADLTIYGPGAALASMEVGVTPRVVEAVGAIVRLDLCCAPLGAGGVYFTQLRGSREGGAPRPPQLLQIHRQRCGCSGTGVCRRLRKQQLLRPESRHPSDFDSRVRRQRCRPRSDAV